MNDRLLNNIISLLNTHLWSKKNKQSDKHNQKIIKPKPQLLNTEILTESKFNLQKSELIESLNKFQSNKDLNQSSEQQRYYFLDTYQKLRSLVLESSDLANNPGWEIDNWEIDVKIVLMLLTHSSSKNKEDIQNLLWLSPQVRRLKLSLSANEYDLQAVEYIERIYQWAEKLQKCPVQ